MHSDKQKAKGQESVLGSKNMQMEQELHLCPYNRFEIKILSLSAICLGRASRERLAAILQTVLQSPSQLSTSLGFGVSIRLNFRFLGTSKISCHC